MYICPFHEFVANIVYYFFKRTGQNVTKRTLFEIIFNIAIDKVIPIENILL